MLKSKTSFGQYAVFGILGIIFLAGVATWPLMVTGAQVLVIAIVLAGLVALVLAGFWGWQFWNLRMTFLRRDEAIAVSEGRKAQIEADSAEFDLRAKVALFPTLKAQIEAGKAIPASLAGISIRQYSSTQNIVERAEALLPAPVEIRPLLPELATKQRVLIVGASDTGKTTLLRHVIDARVNPLVIDPHGTPPKWGDVQHVGQGRDYRAVSASLSWLISEMNKRYKQLGTGQVIEGEHAKMTVIIDEWRAIVSNCKDAGKHIGILLTEARAANMDLIVASHSQLVKALGFEGEGDLRQGFSVINLTGGNGEPRRATLSVGGREKVEFTLPGKYHDRGFSRQLNQFNPAPGTVVIEPEKREAIFGFGVAIEEKQGLIDSQVIDEYRKTGSYSKAFRVWYRLENEKDCTGSIGGNQREKVKEILDRHNVKHGKEVGSGQVAR